MPVYEYYCGNCGATFDVIRSMSAADDPLTCSQCGAGQRVSRTISLFTTVSSTQRASMIDPPPSKTGGCCGGACGCR